MISNFIVIELEALHCGWMDIVLSISMKIEPEIYEWIK